MVYATFSRSPSFRRLRACYSGVLPKAKPTALFRACTSREFSLGNEDVVV